MTAWLMGLAGAPHCVAMCGAGCGAALRVCGAQRQYAQDMLTILAARSVSYMLAGALAALSADAVRGMAQSVLWIRPLWSMMQVAALLLGLSLLYLGRQPSWVDLIAVSINKRVIALSRPSLQRVPRTTKLVVAGALWVALPCGLLYSALVVAALASSPTEGAAVMLAFSAGGAGALLGGSQLWLWLNQSAPSLMRWVPAFGASWSIRFAGLMLFGASAWALLHGLWRPFLNWCGVG